MRPSTSSSHPSRHNGFAIADPIEHAILAIFWNADEDIFHDGQNWCNAKLHCRSVTSLTLQWDRFLASAHQAGFDLHAHCFREVDPAEAPSLLCYLAHDWALARLGACDSFLDASRYEPSKGAVLSDLASAEGSIELYRGDGDGLFHLDFQD